ncbi:MAG: nucleoside recognition domain-containing protein [Bacteroidales bacterium]|jgi:hypothetical protein|nr:nucleoside recognition domain-containing protein [Bacteroidales bacterium]
MRANKSVIRFERLKTQREKFIRNRSYEGIIFLALFIGFFTYLGTQMGVTNMLNTIMYTAWDLLMNTVFFIMGITVLSGALSKLFIEFGVVRLLEVLLRPLMKPLFNLPGVAALAALMTFFSDNPAIISLSHDKGYSGYFKKYQLISLTNFGTAFGMGLIVLAFMASFGYFSAAMIGLFGAAIGAVVSTRLMQRLIRKEIGEEMAVPPQEQEQVLSFKSEGGVFMRFLNSILDGGKSGVNLGLAIIPGVLIISTAVMMLTFGVKDPAAGYQGVAYEGVPIIPKLAGYIDWFFKYLFGFEHPELVAFPITSLGAVGAAMSLVKSFVSEGLINGNVIAVFTAMGMCWSGYLSTHTAMLDSLGFRKLTSKALLSHTLGGVVAGVVANYSYKLFMIFAG